MIDGRQNFNQKGACSVFGEVNRLISQPFLPSSLSFAPALSSAHDHFWHWHAICLFPISTLLLSSVTRRPSPPPSLKPVTWRNTSSAPPPATYTIRNIPWPQEKVLQSAPGYKKREKHLAHKHCPFSLVSWQYFSPISFMEHTCIIPTKIYLYNTFKQTSLWWHTDIYNCRTETIKGSSQVLFIVPCFPGALSDRRS